MQRLIAINKLLIAISHYNNSSKLRKDKKEEMYRKIYRLIEYVENINLDLSGIDDNKIRHTLLEIQIQVRLMQIGECKESFVLPTSVLSTYLLKMRTLARNTIHHSITGTAMKRKRHTQRVKKLMIHALNEAINIGFFTSIHGAEGITEAEGTEIIIGGKNTVINWSDTGKGDLRFNVWWDYTPERCGRYLRKGRLLDLRGIMPDVSSTIRPRIIGFCASCYLCVLEDGSIKLNRHGEFIYEYARSDTVHLLDELPDVEPSGYSLPGRH